MIVFILEMGAYTEGLTGIVAMFVIYNNSQAIVKTRHL